MTTSNPYATLISAVIGISIVLFVASMIYAYRLRVGSHGGSLTWPQIQFHGYILIGFWVIVPPIWFFFEFQCLHPNMLDNANELSRVKHAQDLGRNIWLSFVVVLAAIIGIKWPPGS